VHLHLQGHFRERAVVMRRGENEDVGLVEELAGKGVAGKNSRADAAGDSQHVRQLFQPGTVVVNDGELIDVVSRGQLAGSPAAHRANPEQDGAH
jgi:hypothetical protein